jgi:predicted nucleic acid-binding protein
MNKRWLLDTNVLVDYLRGLPAAVKFIDRIIVTDTCHISVITVAEIFAGVKDGKERQVLESFLSVFETISLDGTIAREGGLHKREYGKSHGVGLADALIAASCEQSNTTLATLNLKHFPMLKKAKNIHQPY